MFLKKRGWRGLRPIRLVGLGVAAAIILSACDITGGGWEPGAVSGKASFGFNLTCNTDSGYLNGSWTYHDKGSGVDIGGTLTDDSGGYPAGPVACTTSVFPGEGAWNLTYTAQHCKSSCVGQAEIHAVDTGATGPSKGDTLGILLLGGPFNGYSNSETLSGGNLTVTS